MEHGKQKAPSMFILLRVGFDASGVEKAERKAAGARAAEGAIRGDGEREVRPDHRPPETGERVERKGKWKWKWT